MKKPKKINGSKAIVAASMLVLPMMMVSNRVSAQGTTTTTTLPTHELEEVSFTFQKIEWKNAKFTLLGVGDGHTLLKAGGGTLVLVDQATGDFFPVSADYFLKKNDLKMHKVPLEDVTITGVSKEGHVWLKSLTTGESFYLDSKGDKIKRIVPLR